jgi:predicted dehydrogenase
MNLTPEQKQIGKDNFDEVVGETRRDFLKKGIAAGVVSGAGLGSMYFGYGAEIKDPIRVGVIGTGDEGSVLMGAVNPDFVQVVAIADIRPYNIYRAFHGDYYSPNALAARPGLMAKYGWTTEDEARKHVKVYTDQYDELLDDPDIEGVIIALPLHLHDAAAIKAMRKGKHVLTEKLMAHSVHQCKEMARVAKETNKLLAVGHQRHYNILYDNAVQSIRRGLLGDIHYIRAQWHRGNMPGRDSWSPDLPPPPGAELTSNEIINAYPMVKKLRSWKRKLTEVTDKKLATDIDLWQHRVAQLEKQVDDQVQAANYGYEEMTLQDGKGTKRTPLEELIRWRLWNRTGGGLMVELGSHQLDAAGIFITADVNEGHKVLPLTVQGVGERSIFPPDRDVADHVFCTYEYPGKGYYKDYEKGEIGAPNKKIVVTYSSINGNGFGGYGETVLGTAGTLLLEKEQEAMLYKGSSTSTRVAVKKGSSGPTLDTTESGAPGLAAALNTAASGPVSRGYTEEIEHWAWCIRNPDSENKPLCGPKVGLADAVIVLTSNIAMKENRRIEYKREWFDVDSDETPEGIKPRKAEDIS